MGRDEHDSVEVELTTQVQRASSLEAAQDAVRADLERAQAGSLIATRQLEDLQERLQHVQVRGEQMESQHAETRRAAEVAQQQAERLQREICVERSAREQLDDQHSLLNAEVDRAEQGMNGARTLLSEEEARHATLEANAAKSRTDAETARSQTSDALGTLNAEVERIENLRSTALIFADSAKAYISQWAHAVSDGADSGSPFKHTVVVASPPQEQDGREGIHAEWSGAPVHAAATIDSAMDTATQHSENDAVPSQTLVHAEEGSPLEQHSIEDDSEVGTIPVELEDEPPMPNFTIQVRNTVVSRSCVGKEFAGEVIGLAAAGATGNELEFAHRGVPSSTVGAQDGARRSLAQRSPKRRRLSNAMGSANNHF